MARASALLLVAFALDRAAAVRIAPPRFGAARAALHTRRPALARRVRATAAPRMAAPLSRTPVDDDDDLVVAEPVVAAVERAGGQARGAGARVTEADIAVSAGIGVDEARRELLALARLVGGELEVARAGEIVFAFAPGVRSALSAASARARRREAWAIWRPRLARAARISFGVALFASFAIVVTAISIIALSSESSSSSSSSSSSDSDRRRSDNSRRTVYVSNSFSPFDLWYISEPRTFDAGQPTDMNFFEACFSFVFGDGDPNESLRETRWRQVGALIRAQGGVVTAEQLAPLLEPSRPPAPDGTADGYGATIDESFVLPALTHFSGVPQLVPDEQGGTRIVYTFPELAATAASGEAEPIDDAPDGPLAEALVPFSLADPVQRVGAGLLGTANLVAVIYLGVLLRAVRLEGGASALAGGPYAMLGTLYPFLRTLLPFLTGYALLFVLAPIVRNVVRGRANRAREKRNALRELWARALDARPPALVRKLRAARTVAPEVRRIGRARAAAASARDAADARAPLAPPYTASAPADEDDALRRFDERLERRTGRRPS
ncbi:hypothetical protein KFE25_011398 [Diacronema lutheri]|uniref:Uncharacterized protein n=1 Tax=Diacronema lutheri TaxID=2081491 RepID=A0A8J5X6R9_DIALT|nr:hypothetical protein KFE25_011398 [Diacronema lutheri]